MIGLAQLTIPVSDLAASVALYEQALEVRAAFTSVEYGWSQLEGIAVPLALYVPGKGGGSGKLDGSLDFQLFADDFEDIRNRLPDSATNAGLHQNDDGSTTLEFSDLDGNRVKMFRASNENGA
ncbi:MAG: hypothetical protein QNJ62_07490 [Methyloceanibacter sp.]|nr:hypothetical protein [Methyloceanibacter sp.]